MTLNNVICRSVVTVGHSFSPQCFQNNCIRNLNCILTKSCERMLNLYQTIPGFNNAEEEAF